MRLGIQKKLMLSYAGIGATVAVVSIVAVVWLRDKVSRFGDFRSPALYAAQDLQNRANSAVKESFAYLASGETTERAEFSRKLAELDERLEAYRRLADAEKERRLYEAIASERRALWEEAQALFGEYERTGSVRAEAFTRYERMSESLVHELRALVELESTEVTEAHAEAASALALAVKLVGAVGIAALAVSAVVGYVFGSRLVRPIRALQDAATHLGEDAYANPSPVPLEGQGELAEVARAFNEMARRVQAGQAELQSQVEQRTAEIQGYAGKLEASLAALRNAQASLVASERLAAVGMLAAGVGHEINNPLSYIVANLSFVHDALARDAARAGSMDPAGRVELLEAVEEAIERSLARNDVVTTTCGREALRYLRARAPFDVVLCDLMPDPSGIDLYQEITRVAPEYLDRVVFMTGGAFTPEARAFLDGVPAQALEKPLHPDDLRRVVQRFVESASGAAGE